MANPVFVDCPEGQWTPVAINVVTGIIRKVLNGSVYLYTYRDTGGTAPTLKSEGAIIFVEEESNFEEISASTPIDIYICCVGGPGKVRVDL